MAAHPIERPPGGRPLTAPGRRDARAAHSGALRPGVLFAGASAVAAVHWLDAALVDRWRGETVSRGLPAALLAVGLAAAAPLVWPRLPRGPRALVALVAGLVTLATGALSVAQVGAGTAEARRPASAAHRHAGPRSAGCAGRAAPSRCSSR
jgi:hypothetical protein